MTGPSRRGSVKVVLKVGDRVLYAAEEHMQKGTLRFRGETKFASGEWFGVELDQELGKNNGSVKDVEYFVCKAGHGIFCREARVSKLIARKSIIRILEDSDGEANGDNNIVVGRAKATGARMEVLERLWNRADVNDNGQLTKDEFNLFMMSVDDTYQESALEDCWNDVNTKVCEADNNVEPGKALNFDIFVQICLEVLQLDDQRLTRGLDILGAAAKAPEGCKRAAVTIQRNLHLCKPPFFSTKASWTRRGWCFWLRNLASKGFEDIKINTCLTKKVLESAPPDMVTVSSNWLPLRPRWLTELRRGRVAIMGLPWSEASLMGSIDHLLEGSERTARMSAEKSVQVCEHIKKRAAILKLGEVSVTFDFHRQAFEVSGPRLHSPVMADPTTVDDEALAPYREEALSKYCRKLSAEEEAAWVECRAEQMLCEELEVEELESMSEAVKSEEKLKRKEQAQADLLAGIEQDARSMALTLYAQEQRKIALAALPRVGCWNDLPFYAALREPLRKVDAKRTELSNEPSSEIISISPWEDLGWNIGRQDPLPTAEAFLAKMDDLSQCPMNSLEEFLQLQDRRQNYLKSLKDLSSLPLPPWQAVYDEEVIVNPQSGNKQCEDEDYDSDDGDNKMYELKLAWRLLQPEDFRSWLYQEAGSSCSKLNCLDFELPDASWQPPEAVGKHWTPDLWRWYGEKSMSPTNASCSGWIQAPVDVIKNDVVVHKKEITLMESQEHDCVQYSSFFIQDAKIGRKSVREKVVPMGESGRLTAIPELFLEGSSRKAPRNVLKVTLLFLEENKHPAPDHEVLDDSDAEPIRKAMVKEMLYASSVSAFQKGHDFPTSIDFSDFREAVENAFAESQRVAATATAAAEAPIAARESSEMTTSASSPSPKAKAGLKRASSKGATKSEAASAKAGARAKANGIAKAKGKAAGRKSTVERKLVVEKEGSGEGVGRGGGEGETGEAVVVATPPGPLPALEVESASAEIMKELPSAVAQVFCARIAATAQLPDATRLCQGKSAKISQAAFNEADTRELEWHLRCNLKEVFAAAPSLKRWASWQVVNMEAAESAQEALRKNREALSKSLVKTVIENISASEQEIRQVPEGKCDNLPDIFAKVFRGDQLTYEDLGKFDEWWTMGPCSVYAYGEPAWRTLPTDAVAQDRLFDVSQECKEASYKLWEKKFLKSQREPCGKKRFITDASKARPNSMQMQRILPEGYSPKEPLEWMKEQLIPEDYTPEKAREDWAARRTKFKDQRRRRKEELAANGETITVWPIECKWPPMETSQAYKKVIAKLEALDTARQAKRSNRAND